jgi:CheY-like chemotaxis protein
MSTILVVEDVQEIRDDICKILELEDYETKEAINGKEALAIIEQQAPDLILCDVIMPEMDGYELFEYLRAHPNYSRIAFAFLSATNLDEKYEHDETIPPFIRKPCLIDDLLTAVARLLE